MSLVVLQTPGGLVDVEGGDLSMPLRGNWILHHETGQDAVAPPGVPPLPPAGTKVVLQVAQKSGPPVTFSGTVRRSGPWAGSSSLVVVGGAGGLLLSPGGEGLPPKSYLGSPAPVPALQVLADILAACGETLDPSVPALLAPLSVPRWTRAGGYDATVALGLLAQAIGCGWRVLDSGRVWMGPETWPRLDSSTLSYQLDDDTDELLISCSPDAPTLRPGTLLSGQGFAVPRQLTQVRYTFGEQSVAAELRYTQEERSDFAAALTTILPPLVYREAHGATVDAQRADGTLDLTLDDPRIGMLPGVPFRAGIVGCALKVGNGERVRVTFEQGDPSLPFAFGFGQAVNATQGIARVGDTVNGGVLAIWTTGTGTSFWLKFFTGLPPGGSYNVNEFEFLTPVQLGALGAQLVDLTAGSTSFPPGSALTWVPFVSGIISSGASFALLRAG